MTEFGLLWFLSQDIDCLKVVASSFWFDSLFLFWQHQNRFQSWQRASWQFDWSLELKKLKTISEAINVANQT
jgi:hypothetical protein